MESNETLEQKVDRLDRSVNGFNDAVRHSASRRSAIALAIALAVLAGLVGLGITERSISKHADCVHDNEIRRAIATSNRVSSEAFVSGLELVFGLGRTPEQRARIEAQAKILLDGINNDPGLIAARASLQPRSCSYWPF